MVGRDSIERWRNAPRLTSFATFFERTARGEGGAPDLAQPQADLSLLDFDLDCAVFADTHARLSGIFDNHYYASIPYRLEEQCRLGAAVLTYALRIWAQTATPAAIYTLGTGTGCLARTLALLGDGRIKTLCCSSTAANRAAFLAKRGSEHAHFFLGPFFALDDKRYSADPDLSPFRNGFDLLFEDTTFQMYDRDRVKQLEFIVPRIRQGGILVQVQKLAHHDHAVYDERERQKDDLFKTRYFSQEHISEKKTEILNTMTDCQVDLPSTISALGTFFRYSVVTWNSGNFYMIVSSNSRASMVDFISLMVKPAIPPAFCYEHLPLVVIDTEFEPIGPALAWRSAQTMAVAPRRSLDS
jgi:tRNA (cmo5U34)-methyltransferase